MPSTEDVLLDLKCKGELELYIVSVGGLEFICRPLTCIQYTTMHQISNELSELDSYEFVIKVCTAYPNEDIVINWIDNSDPMDPGILANKIIEKSSFDSKESIINSYETVKKECSSDFMAMIQIFVSKAFKVSPKELDNMTLNNVFKLLVKAEYAIDSELDIKMILGEEGTPKEQKIQMPISHGMQTTDLSSTKEFMLDPNNSSPIPPEAFS